MSVMLLFAYMLVGPILSSDGALSGRAFTYLDEVLDLIEANSILRNQIDWEAFRATTLADAAGAQAPEQTHPAIRDALERLGDHHSFLREVRDPADRVAAPPATVGLWLNADLGVRVVYPGSPAARAGIRRGDVIVRVEGVAVTLENQERLRERARLAGAALLVERADGTELELTLDGGAYSSRLPPRGYLWQERIGVLEVPSHAGNGPLPRGQYQDLLQEALGDLERAGACAYVVDLRLNAGGNMWPMLAGVGPLLGSVDLGAFVTHDGIEALRWRYDPVSGQIGSSQVTQPLAWHGELPPVAVLLGPITASSGELTALAFEGRPRTRSFGEATAGLATANRTFPLSDGAVLVLTTAYATDRTGHRYAVGEKIQPDERSPIDWAAIGTPDDPVLGEASRWLAQLDACRSANPSSPGNVRSGA